MSCAALFGRDRRGALCRALPCGHGQTILQMGESVMRNLLLSALAISLTLGLVPRLQAEDAPATVAEDVAYGHKSGVALTMDVFTPKKNANGAAVVVVMSGGWVSGRDKMMIF